MSSVAKIDIADDTKEYITQKLHPILGELTQVLIRESPEDTKRFILNWFYMVKHGGDKDVITQNAKLHAELNASQKQLERVNTLAVAMVGDKPEEAESEEMTDEDDELDEIPILVRDPNKMRCSVSAEAYGEWNKKEDFTPPVYPKTDEQKTRLVETLRSSFLFQTLTDQDFQQTVGAMEEVNAKPGDVMINQGDDGDFLFVIEKGTLECTKPIDGEVKVVKTCVAGDVFGELALLYNCPRAATVSCVNEDAILWKLDRKTFNAIVKDAAQKKRDRFMATLKRVPILQGLQEYDLSQIADALQCVQEKVDTVVIKQSDKGDRFYIMEEGAAKAVVDGNTVMEYSSGDFFGELALLHDAPRAASVVTTSDCTLLTLERKAFNRLLGSLQELKQQKYS